MIYKTIKKFRQFLLPSVGSILLASSYNFLGAQSPAVQSQGAQLRVVTTTVDLASITREIGGNLVKVESLAQGKDDLHYLSARPDYILKLSRADLFIQIGADLEVGWVPLILKNSRNRKIQRGARGHCDVSKGLSLLEKGRGEINRQMGDIHSSGNPHYWPDPLNGVRMANYIVSCLADADQTHRDRYEKNYKLFRQRAIALSKKLLRQMKPHFGKSLLAYHNEFLYIARRFRLHIPMYIEEKPGVSPGAAHIRRLKNFIIQNKIKIILVAPWNNIGIAQRIASGTGAKVTVLPIQTGSTPATGSYLKMIETCIQILSKALST